MSSTIEFDTSNHRFKVTGDLVFSTVVRLSKEGEILMSEDNDLVFDFSHVKRCDSSGLTLLTSWMRAAKKQNKSICFINLPEQLSEIAHVCRLDSVLPLVAA